MMLPLVSIVIPIYNVDLKVLKLCINSVQRQLYKNLEIILVDDGSDKIVASYLDEISMDDKRLDVYHRNHMGVSATRNFGIQQAHGEYITFIDADDSVSQDMISFSLKYAISYKADIVLWDHTKVIKHPENYLTSNNEQSRIVLFQGSQIVDLQKNIWNIKPNEECTALKSLPLSVCKLYTSRLLKQNKLFFYDSLNIGEDTLFALEALEHTKKLVAIDKIMYFHIIHDGSLSHGYHPDALVQWSENRKAFHNYLLEGRLSMALYETYNLQVIFALKTLLINTFGHPQCRLKERELKKVLESAEFAHSLNALKWIDVKDDAASIVLLILYRLKFYGTMILLGKIRRKLIIRQASLSRRK